MIFGWLAQNEKNKLAEKQADNQNDYNEDMWEYGNEENQRIYEYKVEGLEIAKRNNERNIQYQETMAVQGYDSAMAIRNYQETEKHKAWAQSISTATDQISFNQMATFNANAQQDRAYSEQLTGLMFDEKQTLQDFGMATMGLNLKRMSDRAEGTRNVQQERLTGLKAASAQKAMGAQGRSANKAVIGLMAESGARQAGIVNAMLFNEQSLDLDVTKMREQLFLDKAMIAATRENALFADKATRIRITQDQLQADMNAMSNILTKPTEIPPIPKPLQLPRAEYQDLLKPSIPPKPGKVVAQTTNPWLALAGDVVNIAGAVATGGASGTFSWGAFLGAL